MNGGQAANIDIVADLAVTAKRRAIGEGGVVADDAVMGDMGVGKEIAVVADRRLATAGIGADMHGHAFADRAVVADDQCGAAALVLGVLRRRAQCRHRIDLGRGANGGRAHHRDMADQLDTVADHRIGANMAERPYAHALADLSAFLHDGGRMD